MFRLKTTDLRRSSSLKLVQDKSELDGDLPSAAVEVPCWKSGPAHKKPKVLFIMPRIPPAHSDMQYAQEMGGYKCLNPPLAPMTLAACIYPHEAEIRDENIGPVCYETDAEIVGISGILCIQTHLDRVIEIAKYFKSLGKIVCIGGGVANLTPEAIRPYCDVIFEGEGEVTWPQFLRDYLNGQHKDHYVQTDKVDMSLSPIPRVDLIDPKNYGMGNVQTARGCPFTCEFCDIIVVYGRKVRSRPIARVIKELELWAAAGMESVFMADDNFTSHRPYVKELLREIIKFNSRLTNPLSFSSQASLDIAKDNELLALLRDANFTGLFIGIESPRKESLVETKKLQNVHAGDLEEAIHKIQSYGIFVSAGLIVGFDHDDKNIFQEQFEFLQKAGVIAPVVNILGAMPKTPLYERMKEAGRIFADRGDRISNLDPVCMSYEELERNHIAAIKRMNTYEAVKERHLRCLSYMRHCKFQNGNNSLRKNLPAVLNIARYYLLSRDQARRQFFLDIWRGTMSTAPRAWKHTWRLLALYAHIYRFYQATSCSMEDAIAY